MTRLCDLPDDLVGEKILAKVPIASLNAVRATCKLWNALSKKYLLGKATTTREHEFVRFTTVNDKVCSLRFHLRKDVGDDDLVPLSIKQVGFLNQVKVHKVFHSEGLVLCVTNSKLVVWNPYLGKTWWIEPDNGDDFDESESCVLGYDNNGNHKILRSSNSFHQSEIYDFISGSWRYLDLIPVDDDFKIDDYQRGVTLKGNTYFFAKVTIWYPPGHFPAGYHAILRFEAFLLCFDFTKERVGQRLPLPFNSHVDDTVTLSCVREEQLAVLYEKCRQSLMLEIWVTDKIEPDAVSWSKFLVVDMDSTNPLTDILLDMRYACFFIDEEKKLAVVFDVDEDECQTAYIIGEDGYFKSMTLEETPDVTFPDYPLIVSSSYVPSLVQIKS